VPVNAGFSTAEAKKRYLSCIGTGMSRADAAKAVGRTVKTIDNWGSDPEFKAQVSEVRARRKRAIEGKADPDLANLDFATWRKRFLGMDTYAHQQQWVDVLEGRVPQELHPNISYVPGRPDRVLLNTPPFHAKSATITRDYIAYKLCMNPNYRVIIVSKTQQQAKKFLYSIRQILTSTVYAELQAAYAPEGGFKGTGESGGWTQNLIYIAGRDSAEKDPSIEALGIGGQIYGARADLIVLDDAVTLSNASEFEKQFTWINQEVSSRLKGGKLLVVGTRVATTDLYSFLLEGDNYVSGTSPWTSLSQPAVLQYAEKPEDWVTLWPKSSRPLDENDNEPDENGLFDAWSGPALHKVRESVSPSTWALIYMQQAVSEDATFHPVCVWGSVDKRRKPGPLRPGEWGGRRQAMEGLYIIMSIDPAGSGEAFALIYAVDRQTKERWLLDAWMHSGSSNVTLYGDLIQQWWETYSYAELTIEKNAGLWLVNDQRIVDFCRNRGIKITPHYTSNNKNEAEWGVASIAPLFGTAQPQGVGGQLRHQDDNLIHIPDPGKNPAIKALLEQLITWQPGKRGNQLRQDGPMALWFAETSARPALGFTHSGPQQNFMQSRYLSRGQRARQMVLPQGSYQALVAPHDR
jgi:hypothetical protein